LGEHGCDEAVQIKLRDKIGVPEEAISRMQDIASGCQFDGGKNIFPESFIQSLLITPWCPRNLQLVSDAFCSFLGGGGGQFGFGIKGSAVALSFRAMTSNTPFCH
jgi:hypothetical protein